MKEHNDIEQLFKESFDRFEAPVRPELWSSVSQQLSGAAQTTAATSSGLSVLTKSIIGLSLVGAIATATYFGFVDNAASSVAQNEVSQKGPSQPASRDMVETHNEQNQDVTSKLPVTSDSKPVEDKLVKEIVEKDTENTGNHDYSEPEKNSSFETKEQPEKSTHKAEVISQETHLQEPKKQTQKPIVNHTNEEQLRAPENVVDPVLLEEHHARHLPEQLPNSFTPNGDGANDYLQFEVKGLTQFRIEVYSARGELVFVSQESTFRWDGLKMDGTPAPDGRYVYQIEGKDEHGNPIKPRVQSLQIIRR